ncbi:hypothetical protein GGX14DRAFT_397436 [Mycena pura]|uniref:Uncharacterized protein n=1 Tax=Mycena pura TaxID=153505 RepID=A0AAD6V8R6_9AGAR|nr:hypothetical protein GGX14DRAFT_397436 [Mycena pura]
MHRPDEEVPGAPGVLTVAMLLTEVFPQVESHICHISPDPALISFAALSGAARENLERRLGRNLLPNVKIQRNAKSLKLRRCFDRRDLETHHRRFAAMFHRFAAMLCWHDHFFLSPHFHPAIPSHPLCSLPAWSFKLSTPPEQAVAMIPQLSQGRHGEAICNTGGLAYRYSFYDPAPLNILKLLTPDRGSYRLPIYDLQWVLLLTPSTPNWRHVW